MIDRDIKLWSTIFILAVNESVSRIGWASWCLCFLHLAIIGFLAAHIAGSSRQTQVVLEDGELQRLPPRLL